MLEFTVENTVPELAAKVIQAASKAEVILAQQILKDTDPYVPSRNNSLSQRAYTQGNKIIYPGPYARYLYYGKLMVDPVTGSAFASKGSTKVLTDKNLVFSTAVHGQAQARWFEASKAVNLEKWEQIAKKAIGEGLGK